MKKALLLSAVLLFAASSFADTIINNFTGYNDGYGPFGAVPITDNATYGEVFTAPEGVSNISSFSFYTGNPIDSGSIITGAYIGKWGQDRVLQLLYDSGAYTYDNAGNETLTFTPQFGAPVTPGQQYIMFLSVSNYWGQSVGSTYLATGGTDPNLNGAAFYNNGSDFYVLLGSPWQGFGLSPDLAVNIAFNNAPEPASLVLMGTGILGVFGAAYRKLF